MKELEVSEIFSGKSYGYLNEARNNLMGFSFIRI